MLLGLESPDYHDAALYCFLCVLTLPGFSNFWNFWYRQGFLTSPHFQGYLTGFSFCGQSTYWLMSTHFSWPSFSSLWSRLPMASLIAQLVKNPSAMWETCFDAWVGKIPWRRERLPTPIFRPEEFHGLCSPWGLKGSDTTERLSTCSPISAVTEIPRVIVSRPPVPWCIKWFCLHLLPPMLSFSHLISFPSCMAKLLVRVG